MTSMKKHTLIDCFSLRARIGWQGLRSDEFKTEGAYLVTGWDFINGRINWDDCYHVSVDRYEQDKGIQLRENDLLVTKDGTVGKTAFVVDCPEQATLNSHIFLVRSKDGSVEPAYLYYVLNSYIFTDFMKNILTGTTIKGLTQGNFYKFVFEAPDVPAQKKIVEVLEAIDAVIDKTREVIQKYTNIKSGMMFDLLKDYGEEAFIRLDTYANFFNGDRSKNYPSAADIVSEGCAFINAGHLQDGKVNYELCDYITPQKYKSLHGAKIEQGDILYCLRGTLGKNAFIEEKVVDGTVASSLVVIRPRDINNKFLFYILNSYIEEKQRRAADNGTAQPNLSALSVAAFKILAPSRPEQDHIVEVLETIDNSIEQERDVLNKYSLLKQGLMQDLLSGKVDAGKLK